MALDPFIPNWWPTIHGKRGILLDELNTNGGDTPCTLSDKCVAPCSEAFPSILVRTRRTGSLPDDDDSEDIYHFPIPSECSCNSVVFNIWSACILTKGNRTLPRFDDWRGQCEQSSIAVTVGYPRDYAKDLDIPGWAFISVPANSEFDVTAALKLANLRHRWTTTQVILPIMTALGTVVVGLLAYMLYRSKLDVTPKWISENIHLFRFKSRIQSIRRANSGSIWSIDPSEEDADFVRVSRTGRPHRSLYKLTPDGPPPEFDGHPAAESEYINHRRRNWRSSNIAVPLRRLSNRVSSAFKSRFLGASPSNKIPMHRFEANTSQSRPSNLSTADLRAGLYSRPAPEANGDLDNLDEGIALMSRQELDDNHVLESQIPGIDFYIMAPGSSHDLEQDFARIDIVVAAATPTASVESSHPITPPNTPPRFTSTVPSTQKTPSPMSSPSTSAGWPRLTQQRASSTWSPRQDPTHTKTPVLTSQNPVFPITPSPRHTWPCREASPSLNVPSERLSFWHSNHRHTSESIWTFPHSSPLQGSDEISPTSLHNTSRRLLNEADFGEILPGPPLRPKGARTLPSPQSGVLVRPGLRTPTEWSPTSLRSGPSHLTATKVPLHSGHRLSSTSYDGSPPNCLRPGHTESMNGTSIIHR